MKTTIAIILGVCVAIGLVLCCATEEHTFGNCQTFETRSRKTMAWNASDFPDLPRKDGWMRICVTHPFLGILDRGRCSGYGEANAFRSALVSATGNAELDCRPPVDESRVRSTLSKLAMNPDEYGSRYYGSFADSPDAWYHSLFVERTSLSRQPDGTVFLTCLAENHSETNQVVTSVEVCGEPADASYSWSKSGETDWIPLSMPFEVPSNGEFPGTFLRIRIPVVKPSDQPDDQPERSLSATLCLANGKRIDIPIPRPLSWGPEK